MELTPLNVVCAEAEGIIEINCDITQGLALAIEHGLESLFGYYKYTNVNLKINSPGGSILGLIHILQCMQVWRNAGRTISTETTFLAASAGAILLAYGTGRMVQRHSMLLFHHARMEGSSNLTSGQAANLALSLQKRDEDIVGQLVRHLLNDYGGVINFVEEGLARCHWLVERGTEVNLALGIPLEKKSGKGPAVLAKAYRNCLSKSSTKPYEDYLAARMKLDSEMSLVEAYALNLIDYVKHVPLFKVCAREMAPVQVSAGLKLAA
jgi:ATP-dependent protease ClpP protease subunit